jgi:hypothetical protein
MISISADIINVKSMIDVYSLICLFKEWYAGETLNTTSVKHLCLFLYTFYLLSKALYPFCYIRRYMRIPFLPLIVIKK